MVFMNLFHAPVWLLKIAVWQDPGIIIPCRQRYDYIAEMTRRIIKRGMGYHKGNRGGTYS